MRDCDDLQQVPTIISGTTKIIPKLGISRERESKKNGAYTALKLRPPSRSQQKKIMLKCLHHKVCEWIRLNTEEKYTCLNVGGP